MRESELVLQSPSSRRGCSIAIWCLVSMHPEQLSEGSSPPGTPFGRHDDSGTGGNNRTVKPRGEACMDSRILFGAFYFKFG